LIRDFIIFQIEPIISLGSNIKILSVNSYYSKIWLYNSAAHSWKRWINDENALSMIKYAGFYSTLIQPDLRVIAINTQYFNIGSQGNYWLYLKDNKIPDQIGFIEYNLKIARKNKEKVYIMAHISSGDPGIDANYSSYIQKYIKEYSDVIAALFFGHTHHESLELFLDDKLNPIKVSYITPSVTPQTNINPSFRRFYYDVNTKEILDFETYTVNLVEANSKKEINWNKQFTATSEYQLNDLQAKDWFNFVQRMKIK